MKTLILILILSFCAFGQTDLPIMGKPSDLAGKKKVYLLADTTDSRELIKKVIDKNKSLEIVSDAVDADFILEFKQISKTTPAKIGMGTFTEIAEMSAYFYNSDKRKIVAWSETKDKYKKGWGGTKKNEAYLTTQFLKAIK